VQKQDGDKKLRPRHSKHRTRSDPEEEEEDENNMSSDGSETESDTEINVQRVHPKPQKQVQTSLDLKTSLQSQIKVRIPAQNQVTNQVQTPIETQNSKVQIPAQSQVPTQIPTQVPTQVLPQIPTQVLSQIPTQIPTQVPNPAQTQVQAQVQAQVQVPLLLHLGSPFNLQSGGPILLTAAQNTLVAQLRGQEQNPTSINAKGAAQEKRAIQNKKEKSEIQILNPNAMNFQHEEQVLTSHDKPQVLREQKVEVSHREVIQTSPSDKTQKQQSTQSPQRPTHSSRGRPLKRKFFPDEEVPVRRVQRESVEPMVCSSKPGPETESETQSSQRQTEQKDKRRADSERPLEARVMVQQCSRARVKTRAGVDGAESQYAQIGEGLVVYVCFFDGATDDTTQRIADSIMNTRFFRTSLRRQVSVLDLRGSVLLVPQESLGFEPGPRRSMQSRGMSEAWVSKQLFSSLYLHCTQLLCARATGEGAMEQGLYGQRQEIEITSTEPMSHMLEF
ncbi:hypothetical protein NQD34_016628, partial [Periophthalmus magnuspinnatus]